jgi:hypothetical protein
MGDTGSQNTGNFQANANTVVGGGRKPLLPKAKGSLSKSRWLIRFVTFPIIIAWCWGQFSTWYFTETESISPNTIDINQGTWRFESEKYGIATYSKAVPNSPLLALRGEGILNMHIAEAVSTFLDAYRCYDWIDMLDSMLELPYDKNTIILPGDENRSGNKGAKEKKNGLLSSFFSSSSSSGNSVMTNVLDLARVTRSESDKNKKNRISSWQNNKHLAKLYDKTNFKYTDVVHQVLKLPWPISPREMVIQREWDFDYNTKIVTMSYKSVEDARIPHKKGVVRAFCPHMLWKFAKVDVEFDEDAKRKKKIPRKKPAKSRKDAIDSVGSGPDDGEALTKVEIECFVDSKGSIPSWFINYIQSNWPTKSLLAFQSLVDKSDGYAHWPSLKKW